LKNVVSFSLWGENPKYWKGALENINIIKDILPEWYIHFYVDENCKIELINSLRFSNTEIRLVHSDFLGNTLNQQSIHSHQGMFWRFMSSLDKDVDIFLSRDCDSRISNREINAINEWKKTGKRFHIMRDHPYHIAAILGGMWGCRGGLMREINLEQKIIEWTNRNIQRYNLGVDQDFLAQIIYPLIKNECYEHSEFNIKFMNDTHPFPTPRIDYEFVGDVFDADNMRHPDYWKIIKNNTKL
jgi:hypothetical protein